MMLMMPMATIWRMSQGGWSYGKKQHSGGGYLIVQFHMFHVIGDCSPCYGNSFPKQEELQLAEATSSFRDQNFQELL